MSKSGSFRASLVLAKPADTGTNRTPRSLPPQADRAYEEIGGEDRPSGSPAVEVSTVYCRAKYTKPNGVEAGGDCSLVAAAAPRARNKVRKSVTVHVDLIH